MSSLPPLDSNASDPAVLELLAALVRIERPMVCLETGTYRGHGAVAIGRALRDNGGGTLYTCDPVDHGIELLLAELELEEWVSFHPTPAFELLRRVTSPIDFAYIDHSGGTRNEVFDRVRDQLAPGGIIVIDDTGPNAVWRDGREGASKAWVRQKCDLLLEGARGVGIYRAD